MNPVQLFARHPGPFFAVLDGPCASGKTTLAAFLEHAIPNLYIVHMDDYYIPMAQKTPERLSVPGGNADTERLLEEVLLPHRLSAQRRLPTLQRHPPRPDRWSTCFETVSQPMDSPGKELPAVLSLTRSGLAGHRPD